MVYCAAKQFSTFAVRVRLPTAVARNMNCRMQHESGSSCIHLLPFCCRARSALGTLQSHYYGTDKSSACFDTSASLTPIA
jgi:hypothetical protein